MGTEGAGLQVFLPVVWVYDQWLLHTTACCRLTGFRHLFYTSAKAYQQIFNNFASEINVIHGFVKLHNCFRGFDLAFQA